MAKQRALIDNNITYQVFMKSMEFRNLTPNVAKAGGLHSQGVKDEAVIGYRDPLTTQDL
ncbi:hypothetical protein N9934_05645 [Desulfosarcina sp.]|nr:hypothetical protein [Desulfosarcina sp.]